MSNKCMICSRKLDGRRIISCSTRLKHTGRPIYEVVKQVLPQKFAQYPFYSDENNQKLLFIGEDFTDKTENIVKANKVPFSECCNDLHNSAKVHKLCFRCYRLVLGIDFHGFELRKLKGQINKLSEESKEKEETNTKQDGLSLKSTIDGGNNIETNNDLNNIQVFKSIDPTDKELIVHENPSLNKELKIIQEKVDTHPILNLTNPAFISDEVEVDNGNTKRNRKCKRLLDFEYLDVNERYIRKASMNDKVDKHYEEFSKDTDTKSKKKGPILCRNCHEKFETKKSFNSHGCNKSIHTLKKNAYSCKGCGINMNTKQSYIEHIESCYKNIAVQCNYCPVKLPSAAFLPRHMEAFHEGETVFSKDVLCDQCGREFSRKESLDRHQATVHGVSYGQHQCPKCGRTFLHTSLLAEHMRAHRGYSCDQCAKTFSCNSNLRLHLRTHHQNKNLYHCSECNKHWKFHTSYIYHMRKVHDVNPHKCSRCRRHFSSEAEFLAHNNNCHKGGSELENKESESRFGVHHNESRKCFKSGNLLIKTEETNTKTSNINENSSVFRRNEKELKEISEHLPLKPHTSTPLNFVPQEIIVFRNQDDVYGKSDNSFNRSKGIIQELNYKKDLITNSKQLMLKDKDEIGEPPIESDVLRSRSFDLNNRKEQIGYERNQHEFECVNPHETNSSLKSEVAALQYVHGDIIEINANPRDEYDVNILSSEDIVVETCEEYPPECQYVIIVEDQGQL